MRCAKVRRKIDAAYEDDPRVLRHLPECPSCAGALRLSLEPGRLVAARGVPGDVARLRPGLVPAVLARAAGAGAAGGASSWRLRRVLRPALAAMAVGLAAVVVGLVSVERATPPAPAPAARAQAPEASAPGGAAFKMVRTGRDVSIVFHGNGTRTHRIAVSTRPDFSTAQVTEFRGDRWVDTAPQPAAGGVVFYRID